MSFILLNEFLPYKWKAEIGFFYFFLTLLLWLGISIPLECGGINSITSNILYYIFPSLAALILIGGKVGVKNSFGFFVGYVLILPILSTSVLFFLVATL